MTKTFNQIKICEWCKKEFSFEEFKNKLTSSYGIGAWCNKKFCNEECRKKYYKSKNKNLLKSTYHDQTLLELNKTIKGKINLIQNTQEENPDIETEDTNYEFEVFSLINKWNKKYERQRDNKKHILIIGINPNIKKYFDEIRFYNTP